MENYRVIPGAILIVLGVGFLLGIDVWTYFWPAILIFLGIRMMTSNNSRKEIGSYVKEETVDTDRLDIDVILSAMNKKIVSDDFGGGKVNVIFAGGELDLREAKTKKEVVEIEFNSIFGGGKIMVPADWSVNTQVTGIFGGFANNTTLPKKGEEKTRLVIKGAAVFGGGEVTN